MERPDDAAAPDAASRPRADSAPSLPLPRSQVSPLLPSLRLSAPRTLSLTLLLATLTAFELLFALYWVRLRLLPTLPVFGALAAFAAWVGRGALGEMRGRRREAERREGGKDE